MTGALATHRDIRELLRGRAHPGAWIDSHRPRLTLHTVAEPAPRALDGDAIAHELIADLAALLGDWNAWTASGPDVDERRMRERARALAAAAAPGLTVAAVRWADEDAEKLLDEFALAPDRAWRPTIDPGVLQELLEVIMTAHLTDERHGAGHLFERSLACAWRSAAEQIAEQAAADSARALRSALREHYLTTRDQVITGGWRRDQRLAALMDQAAWQNALIAAAGSEDAVKHTPALWLTSSVQHRLHAQNALRADRER